MRSESCRFKFSFSILRLSFSSLRDFTKSEGGEEPGLVITGRILMGVPRLVVGPRRIILVRWSGELCIVEIRGGDLFNGRVVGGLSSGRSMGRTLVAEGRTRGVENGKTIEEIGEKSQKDDMSGRDEPLPGMRTKQRATSPSW